MQATQIVIRNHNKEKLDALRNAVLNAALPNPPEESIQLIYLNLIDFFTPWHLRILKFIDDPPNIYNEYVFRNTIITTNHIGIMLIEFFPELNNNYSLCNQIIKDLYDRGMINPMDRPDINILKLLGSSQTTPFGKAFLQFILTPKGL